MRNGKEIVWGAGYSSSTEAMHKQGYFESTGRRIAVQRQQVVIGHRSAATYIDALVVDRLEEAVRRLKQAGESEAVAIVRRVKDEYVAQAEASKVQPGGLPNEPEKAPAGMTPSSDLYPADEDEIRVRID